MALSLKLTLFNYTFFLNRFPVCFNIFGLLFLVTPCLVVACIKWLPIKKKTPSQWYVRYCRYNRIRGLWTQVLDAGLWTLDTRIWSLDSRRWGLDAWIWSLDSRRWTLNAGHCFLLTEELTSDPDSVQLNYLSFSAGIF